jgi:hypothetical protein
VLIQCLVERDGPSVASIGGFTYTFEEQLDGAKVCDVNNGGHRERMLSMPAFYKVYDPGQASSLPPEENADPAVDIPDFDFMEAGEIRAWAKANLRLKVNGTFGHGKAVEVVEQELRRRGWIA